MAAARQFSCVSEVLSKILESQFFIPKLVLKIVVASFFDKRVVQKWKSEFTSSLMKRTLDENFEFLNWTV